MFDPGTFQAFQKGLGKMKARSGRGNGPGMTGIDCLVAVPVLPARTGSGVLLSNVRREWDFPVLLG